MSDDPAQSQPSPDHPTEADTPDPFAGLPLKLDSDDGAEESSDSVIEDETIERPVAELLPPRAAPAEAVWLMRWLLFGGLLSGALVLASIALAVLCGVMPVEWRGPFLAFCCVVAIFLTRYYVAKGVPSRAVCHRVLCIGGLAIAGLVILHSLVRASIRFIDGGSPGSVLGEFFVFALLGIGGCMAFVQCLRERSWANRAISVALLVFIALMALQPFTGYGLLARQPVLELGPLIACLPAIVAVAAFAAGLALLLELTHVLPASRHRPVAQRRGHMLLSILWALPLLAATVFFTWQLVARQGTASASGWLWRLAALCQGACLLPLVLEGMVVAWRKRSDLWADMCAATDFGWVLVSIGGLACLIVWMLTHRGGGLEMLLMCAGIFAGVLGAWLAGTRGDWTSRWALLPWIVLAACAMCSLGYVLDIARNGGWPDTTSWTLALASQWCVVVVGLSLGAAGLGVKRIRARGKQPRLAMWADASLLSTAGWASAALLLAALFAQSAGTAAVTAGVAGVLQGGGLVARDLLTVTGGNVFARYVVRAAAPFQGMLSGSGRMAILACILVAVLAVHLVSASRVRWSLYALVALWVLPLTAGLAFAVLYASRMFFPLREPGLVTGLGRYIGSHFTARLVLLAIFLMLLVRFVEATRSVVRLLRTPRPRRFSAFAGVAGPGGRLTLSQNPHLTFLVHMGTLSALLGLALAAILYMGPVVTSFLTELHGLSTAWSHSLMGFASRIGQLSAQWSGYAIATGMVVFVLIALHEEVRRGRRGLYPVVTVVWLLLVVPLAFSLVTELVSQLETGSTYRSAVLGAATGILAVFLIAATALWTGYWRRGEMQRPDVTGVATPAHPTSTADSLGSIGLVLCVGGGLLVLHAALMQTAPYAELADRAARSLYWLVDRIAFHIEYARAKLEMRQSIQGVSIGLAAVSTAVLALHLVARHYVAWARNGLLALWTGMALAGAVAAGFILSRRPFGTWGPQHVVGALLLAALLVRIVVAVANARSWLMPRSA